MPEAKSFALNVEIDPTGRAASLRLADDAEKVIGTHDVRLESQPASMWEAIFDTPAYLLRTKRAPAASAEEPDPTSAAGAVESLEQLGVFIGRQLLGAPIMTALAAGDERRSLVVRVASRADDQGSAAPMDPLTSAFARIPWFIARPALGAKPLVQRNVVVRSAPLRASGAARSPSAGARERGEPLRVLCVHVEAPGARPLTARLERERLRDLFYDEIMPDNQVMLDVLCHGATRDALRQKLRDAGGYHIIHWSGHGYVASQSERDDNAAIEANLSGAELAELLAEAGGFLPQLVFLSASNAEPIGPVESWPSLKAALLDPRARDDQASERASIPAQKLDAILAKRGGVGQTAISLLEAGVPSVVLTRHPVSGAYARRLARRFYRSLLGANNPQPADSALALAQRDLLADPRVSEHQPADHASAIALGEIGARFELERGQSPDLALRRPQPQPLLRGRADLEPPRAFAGRGAELAQLAASWLPKRGAAVALIHGAAGVGKTAFAAEAVHLWHRQFHWVMAFQARRPGLLLDDFYRELDKRLTRASPAYRERCKENEERRVYLPPRQDLSGQERYELLRDNLIDVLGTASILLVLDGFEENLGPVPVEEGYVASDPEWDTLLRAFVEGLADVTGSRVLITSRFPIASLAGSTEVATLHLGPLLANEALSILEESEALRAFVRGGLPDRELAWRVLETSAGHPPALQRLGDLAREGRALLESGVGLRPSPSPMSLRSPGTTPPNVSADALDRSPPSIRSSPVSKRPVIAYATGSEDEASAEALPVMPPIPPSARVPLDLLPPGPPPTPPPPPPAGPPKPPSFRAFGPPPVGPITTEPPAAKEDAPIAVGSPDKVAQRAVALLIERLSPAERCLLWRITRAPAPAPIELVERMAEIGP